MAATLSCGLGPPWCVLSMLCNTTHVKTNVSENLAIALLCLVRQYICLLKLKTNTPIPPACRDPIVCYCLSPVELTSTVGFRAFVFSVLVWMVGGLVHGSNLVCLSLRLVLTRCDMFLWPLLSVLMLSHLIMQKNIQTPNEIGIWICLGDKLAHVFPAL